MAGCSLARMTILNLMLGKGRGGLEQASVDYAEALQLAKIDALTLITPGAWAETSLVTAALPHETLANANRWDPFATHRLRVIAKRTKAKAILCHGNRALSLAIRALKGRVPIIAVAHNPATRRFGNADMCFAITNHLGAHLKSGGAKQVIHMPNMVRVPPRMQRPAYRTPPIIGAMGRLDYKKGFDVFIDALAILAEKKIPFRAKLGGDGAEMEALQKRIRAYAIDDRVELIGWVQDKHIFFDSIDLFVLPSRQEAFGLTLVEAMAHRVPVITSDAFGPREIAHHGEDALVTEHDDAEQLAAALIQLINDPATATRLGDAGRALVEKQYTMQAMANRLQAALTPYIGAHE